MPRPLDPEEQALWMRVAHSVRPLFGRSAPSEPTTPPKPIEAPGQPVTPTKLARMLTRRGPAPSYTLDATWDRRLARGLVQPDLTLDLHGHTLAAAHAALDAGLARAVAAQARLVLLVTGRPPTAEWTGGPRRGAIRAGVGDWLAASRFSDRIAAVRPAHPRHGGAGALYLVLRRARGG